MLDTAELKKRYAQNLDALLRVTCHSRKQFAEAAGIPYAVVRKQISGGISRLDARNEDHLGKIIAYFALPNCQILWRPRLLELLLTTEDGIPFTTKFNLEREPAKRQLTHLEKVEAILKTDGPEAMALKVIIDLMYAELERNPQ